MNRKMISKHLMLLFNEVRNNQGVMSYIISKHLMLLFNSTYLDMIKTLLRFQNISCYCLTGSIHIHCLHALGISKHLMLLFNCQNTLHFHHFFSFQNISCYCLTGMEWKPTKQIVEFQNISCYCLTYKKADRTA